jgi:hypothetical protein
MNHAMQTPVMITLNNGVYVYLMSTAVGGMASQHACIPCCAVPIPVTGPSGIFGYVEYILLGDHAHIMTHHHNGQPRCLLPPL